MPDEAPVAWELGYGVRLPDGTWRGTSCSVGGPMFVYVKDGRIIRITPIEFGPDDAESWEIEARGRIFKPPRKTLLAPYVLSLRSRVYSPERLLTPMKRVDFDPSKPPGQRNEENRGKSGYEPISWEEALDIIAQEIERIKKQYGPEAIAATADSHYEWGNIHYRHSTFFRFFNLLGFTYVDHNPDSWEGWHWGAMLMWGFHWRLGCSEQYDLLWDALNHCDMIVFWSADPDTNRAIGYQGYESAPWRQWLKELGVKVVVIDPFYNWTAHIMWADKWLAPRPGTDTALAAAIAYVWITEGTYDKKFVEEKCYGFEEFKKYILGETDGIPKTPKWAEEKTGIPAREIIALAREWARKRTMLAAGGLGGWGAACRQAYGHEWARFMVALAAMQGIGKPGVNIWSTTQGAPSTYEDFLFFPGYAEGGISGDPVKTAAFVHLLPRGMTRMPTYCTIHDNQHIARLLLPECITNPPEKYVEWRGRGFCGESLQHQFRPYRYPAPGYERLRMLYRVGAAYIGTMTHTNRWVRAYRSKKLEFFVVQTMFKNEPEAKFADILLPVCTNLERWDISEWASCSGYIPHSYTGVNHRVIVLHMKAIEPLGQSKSDYWIFAQLAKRLGFWYEFTEGGKTDLDWVKRMFEVSDLPKFITWEEFKRKGYFVVPSPKPYRPRVALSWYYQGRERDTPDWAPTWSSPDRRSLATPTGKIEFYSKMIERFRKEDPGEERPVIPMYIPSWEGHESDLAKKYTLQLITPHPRYSYHSHHDGKGTWINEIPEHRIKKEDGRYYWVLYINPKDAEARGIRDGDLVLVYNDRGSVVCVAKVTERVRPGVVRAWESCNVYDPIGEPGDPGSIDRGGCLNLITPEKFLSKNACGMAPNTCLVEVRRIDLATLQELEKKWKAGEKIDFRKAFGIA
jgi:trimethylamine-N-oxide reductase (cytochrome c)